MKRVRVFYSVLQGSFVSVAVIVKNRDEIFDTAGLLGIPVYMS